MMDFLRDPGRAVVPLSHRGVVVILPLALIVSGCDHSPTATQSMHAPSIARVAHGPLASMVTATGTLHAMTTQSLGFPQGGRITAITVSVGDHVTAGQILAKVDDSRQKIVVKNAQDEVTRQRALLDQVTAENTPGRASAELERSEQLLAATQKAADESYRADTIAIGQLERQLKFDEDNLKRQEKELSVDRRSCPNYPNPPSSGTTATVTTGSGSSSSPPPGDVGPCEFLESRFDSIASAQRQIISDQTDIDNARARRDSDQAQEQANIDVQRVGLILAQDKRGLAGTDTHYSLLEQQQNLDEAKNNLMLAQQALAATVVKSSFSGTVANINGRVGKVLTASYHTSLPALAGDPLAGDRSPAGRQVPTNSSDADALIVLDHLNSFQMTVPVTKADAGRMTPSQAVDVSFPAIPGLSRKATVTDIAPVTSTASDDQNYLVTLALTELDPRLHDGMTAQAHIITRVVTNALVVPSAAVRGIGQTGTVSLVGPSGARHEVPVQIGAVGEHDAQVVSGLREGDQVAVPEAR